MVAGVKYGGMRAVGHGNEKEALAELWGDGQVLCLDCGSGYINLYT